MQEHSEIKAPEFFFEPRRAIASSRSIVITIPHAWRIHHNIKPGDTFKASMDDRQRLIIEVVKESEQ